MLGASGLFWGFGASKARRACRVKGVKGPWGLGTRGQRLKLSCDLKS